MSLVRANKRDTGSGTDRCAHLEVLWSSVAWAFPQTPPDREKALLLPRGQTGPQVASMTGRRGQEEGPLPCQTILSLPGRSLLRLPGEELFYTQSEKRLPAWERGLSG